MGKNSKNERKSGLEVEIKIRDGLKKVDEQTFKLSATMIKALAFEVYKLDLKTDLKDLDKARKEFIEFKQFLGKYA